MAYTPITAWQAVGSPDRAWLGAAVRLVIDTDASTAASYSVYAECTAYQYPGAAETLGCLWYYNGSLITPPMYHQATWTNGTGPVGDTYRVSLGTFTAGQTATSAQWRVAIDLTGGRVYSYYASASYTVPSAPADPSTITNTRNSDTQNTAAWTLPATTYTRARLQRLTDGTTVGAEWTFAADSGVLQYTDTGTAAAHSYAYKIRLELVPEAGEEFALYSGWKTSGLTYNSPAAPSSISGARTGASTVRVTLANTATTSTGLEVQASTNSADWTGATTTTVAGAGVTTADITGLAGIYYFRARNTRGALVSAWSPISDPVATLTAPNAPTLTAPANGAVLNYTQANTATLRWTHNPVDGSAQTSAQIQTSTDGGSTWTTASVTTAQEYALALSGVIGQTVTWRVRTKGAAADWSPYSATRTFTAYPQPTITIVLKDGNGNVCTNGTLADMPLAYTITASDGYTAPASGAVEIAGYSEPIDVGAMAGSIDPAELQLDNATTYTFTASVQMTSGLQGAAAVTVTTNYADPQAGTLAVTDADGIETLTVGLAPMEAGEVAADSISVYRITAAGAVLLASGLSAGATITDKYAPLNTPFTYRVRTYSAGGAARSADVSHTISTNRWMIISGDKVAWGIWSPAGSLAWGRPEKTRVQYAGRTYPVSYDGTALSDTRSTAWVLLDIEELARFVEIMEEGGRGVYKSADGAVFMADYDLRVSANYQSPARYGTATLSITRVESGAL